MAWVSRSSECEAIFSCTAFARYAAALGDSEAIRKLPEQSGGRLYRKPRFAGGKRMRVGGGVERGTLSPMRLVKMVSSMRNAAILITMQFVSIAVCLCQIKIPLVD